MPFSKDLLERCSTATKKSPTSFVKRFQTVDAVDAVATFVATTNIELKCEIDPFDEKVVYINFKSERECTEFGAAFASYKEPAFTPGKGKPAPVFNDGMLPPPPMPTAGPAPIVSVFFYASAGTVIPPEVTVDRTITNGVMVCFGNVPVSAISKDDREGSKGAHKVTIETSVFSLSTKLDHQISTVHAIKCLEQWQRAKQADSQAHEAHVMDCVAMREIFLIRGEYLTVMRHSGRKKTLLPGQKHVLYRVSASTPASAPASAQVVPLPVVSKIVKGRRNTPWADDDDDEVDDDVETTDVPSEMELLAREMKALEKSNRDIEASIEASIEARKVAAAKKAEEEALVAIRRKRDELLARQAELQAKQATLLSA